MRNVQLKNSIDSHYNLIRSLLHELADLALDSNDNEISKHAAVSLEKLTRSGVNLLNEIASQNPGALKLHAMEKADWPYLITEHEALKKNISIFKKIELGKFNRIKTTGVEMGSTLQEWIQKMYHSMERIRKDNIEFIEKSYGQIDESIIYDIKNLTPINKASSKEWFKLAWLLFEDYCNKINTKISDHIVIRELGLPGATERALDRHNQKIVDLADLKKKYEEDIDLKDKIYEINIKLKKIYNTKPKIYESDIVERAKSRLKSAFELRFKD